MDPRPFPVHGHQSQILNNPTGSPSTQTGCLTERMPVMPYRVGIHRPVDLSFLSFFKTPPLPQLSTFTAPLMKGWVVLDSLPPENEESYAKGWYSGFGEEIWATAEEKYSQSQVSDVEGMATGQSESYGSIEFNSHAAAEGASFGSGDKRQDDSAEFSVIVGNLAAEVTDYVLQQTFKVYYTSVKGAQVIYDGTSGRSKGYGFVSFADKDEQMRSVTEMNGHYCLSRPMYIGPLSTGLASFPKDTFQSFLGTQNESAPNKNESAPNKTTVGNFDHPAIFVGGLDSDVTEENLRQVFSQFGGLSHVKIHEGKRCGFVQFDNRACAEKAYMTLNGSQLGGSDIQLLWGPSTSKEQHLDSNQRPDAAGNMLNEYNGSYEAYGYVVTNRYSFQGGRAVCYQHHQKQ